MEKLLQIKPGTTGTRSYLPKNYKTEDTEVNQSTDSRLLELINQIKNGDPKAMETLSVKYIQLVIKIAGDFKGNGLTDLELKGNNGLIKAAENFDNSRGIDFSAFATWSVRQEIIRAIDEYEFVKPLPLNKIGLLSKKNFWNQNPKERVDLLL